MNAASLPGFTAESSLYTTTEHYRLAADAAASASPAGVYPALPRICNVLAELVWGAYNEGAYNRAEFWEGLMDRAGCFD